MGTSKNLATDRLVGLFSPIEAKNAVNTMCIYEYFGNEWWKKTCQDGGRWVFRGTPNISSQGVKIAPPV
ncbi:MAG: hypothetical protein FWB91_12225 [Defluviitaleaceae bacterium]|nr:hypothetical protein [Defluviitaleaceae bacterium]